MDDKALTALVLRYVAHRRDSGHLNARSAEQVRSRLMDFASTVNVPPGKVTRRHVERWMERPDLAPQYRRCRLSALRGFCKWCVAHGHMVKDPTLTVQAPKIPPALPKRMTTAEAQALVAEVRHDSRMSLIVLWALQLGLRRVELARLRVEDVDFAERSVTIRGKGGHGAETDTLPIPVEAWSALVRYLAEVPHSHGPLIRSRKHPERGLHEHTISEYVRDAMVAAGVKRPGDSTRTPHSTRHSCAHALLERTDNVRLVQQALRHRSVRSTEVYLRGQVGDLRGVMEGRTYVSGEVPGQGVLLD